MAPKYKLTYFNTAGRAERLRYIFAYAGQEYEDCRIRKEDWPNFKPSTPFGKVPILEIDGKVVSQTNAIARYLAKQFGLLGSDEDEAFRADELVEALSDLTMVYRRRMNENRPEAIESLKKEEAYFLDKFEEILSKSSSGFLVGAKPTWADMVFATTFASPDAAEALKSYPAIAAHLDRINNLTGIKEYLEKRPKGD